VKHKNAHGFGVSQDSTLSAPPFAPEESAVEEDALRMSLFTNGKCPDCHGKDGFFHGPEGGMCENIMCANPECGSRFNIVPPCYIFPPGFAERISPASPLKKELSLCVGEGR